MTAVLLDLDGTLIDPFEGITRCHQHALESLGVRPVPSQRELCVHIGPPLRSAFRVLLGGAASGEDIERAVALYRERFSTVGLFESTPYEGVAPMLEALRERGCRLFLATSKLQAYAERIVSHFELRGFLTRVYGTEPGARLDDKADLLAQLLATEGLAPSEAVMVGDREHDVVAARRNGVRSIGVTWGYGSRVELEAAGADVICGTPAEVVAAVAR